MDLVSAISEGHLDRHNDENGGVYRSTRQAQRVGSRNDVGNERNLKKRIVVGYGNPETSRVITPHLPHLDTKKMSRDNTHPVNGISRHQNDPILKLKREVHQRDSHIPGLHVFNSLKNPELQNHINKMAEHNDFIKKLKADRENEIKLRNQTSTASYSTQEVHDERGSIHLASSLNTQRHNIHHSPKQFNFNIAREQKTTHSPVAITKAIVTPSSVRSYHSQSSRFSNGTGINSNQRRGNELRRIDGSDHNTHPEMERDVGRISARPYNTNDDVIYRSRNYSMEKDDIFIRPKRGLSTTSSPRASRNYIDGKATKSHGRCRKEESEVNHMEGLVSDITSRDRRFSRSCSPGARLRQRREEFDHSEQHLSQPTKSFRSTSPHQVPRTPESINLTKMTLLRNTRSDYTYDTPLSNPENYTQSYRDNQIVARQNSNVTPTEFRRGSIQVTRSRSRDERSLRSRRSECSQRSFNRSSSEERRIECLPRTPNRSRSRSVDRKTLMHMQQCDGQSGSQRRIAISTPNRLSPGHSTSQSSHPTNVPYIEIPHPSQFHGGGRSSTSRYDKSNCESSYDSRKPISRATNFSENRSDFLHNNRQDAHRVVSPEVASSKKGSAKNIRVLTTQKKEERKQDACQTTADITSQDSDSESAESTESPLTFDTSRKLMSLYPEGPCWLQMFLNISCILCVIAVLLLVVMFLVMFLQGRLQSFGLKRTASPTISFSPTKNPSTSPTFRPTDQPTFTPTRIPTPNPSTPKPTVRPTFTPTRRPTYFPTANPTFHPTTRTPTVFPTTPLPTFNPTTSPPTFTPTSSPPTHIPSHVPSTTYKPSLPVPTDRPSEGQAVTFYVTAGSYTQLQIYDPYRKSLFMEELENIIDSDGVFLVHLGNFNVPQLTLCQKSSYINLRDFLVRYSKVPAIMTNGADDYIRCPNPYQGFSFWLEYYSSIESNWRVDGLEIQRMDEHVENFAIIQKRILFVGIDVVSGAVNTVTDKLQRENFNFDWIMRQVNSNYFKIDATVILGNEPPSVPNAKNVNQNPHFNFFDAVVKDIIIPAQMPTLYLHESNDSWRVQKPFNTDLMTVVNVRRSHFPFMKVTVDPSNKFTFLHSQAD